MKYIAGNTIQNKKTVISYKIKRIRKVNQNEQIRVNNTHEPIINKELFEKVQCIIEKRGTNAKLKYDYLFRGIIYCYHCKRKLQIVLKKNSKSKAKSHPYIICSNAKIHKCYPINISYEKFEKYIIYILKEICKKYSDKKILYEIYKKYQNKNINIKEKFKEKIEQINKEIFNINNNLDKMYIDKLNNILQEEDYIRIAQKLKEEILKLKNKKEELEKNIIKIENKKETKNSEKEINEIIEEFLKFEKIDKLFLYRLINKIEIDKNKNIYIYFNFSKINNKY